MKNHPNKHPYIPRIICRMNTGSRIIWSKKDKANRRQNLNRQARDWVPD